MSWNLWSTPAATKITDPLVIGRISPPTITFARPDITT